MPQNLIDVLATDLETAETDDAESSTVNSCQIEEDDEIDNIIDTIFEDDNDWDY